MNLAQSSNATVNGLIAYCPEVPGANGQDKTKQACLTNLSEAIKLILEDRREDALLSLQ